MTDMRERWLRSPRWLVRVVMGTFFGLWMTVAGALRHGGPTWVDLAAGVIAGLLFGVVAGGQIHRMSQEAMADSGGRVLHRVVRRASWRGPAPDDPADRAAALALVERQHDQLGRQRRWSLPFYGVMVALAGWLATHRSELWWLAVVFWLVVILATLWLPRRLAARRRVLTAGSSSPSGA